MGLASSTTSLVCLRCAIFKATRTCITTPLRSLAGPGGAFDVPKQKCPPDRGSSDCVTGRPASYTPSAPTRLSTSPLELTYFRNSPECTPSLPSNHSYLASLSAAAPRAIPARGANYDVATPPLTPDDGPESDKAVTAKQQQDALDFLMTVFPRDGLSALPHAKSVSISAPNMGASFDGVVLDIPGKTKTLYVDGKSAQTVSLRESIVALLDLADESLQCSALVIVLERSSPVLGDLLHALMYVGGTVVTRPPYQVDSAFVLVGLEI
ncbi:hypothetical protein HGRIS_002199 [Hohenbuehelia grisea]|uniref:Ornithine decarboxylase antizyme n=1 Tax=Hohenbuehelia grisea TaxID=104357 RepID=A0ABR3JJW7_9AGAR